MDAADADDEAAVALAAAVFADVAAFVSDVFASAADAAAAFSDAAAAVADAPASPALEAACVSDVFAAVSDAPARSADNRNLFFHHPLTIALKMDLQPDRCRIAVALAVGLHQ